MRGESFDGAIRLSADFTHRVMDYTTELGTPVREGVAFEKFLFELAEGKN